MLAACRRSPARQAAFSPGRRLRHGRGGQWGPVPAAARRARCGPPDGVAPSPAAPGDTGPAGHRRRAFARSADRVCQAGKIAGPGLLLARSRPGSGALISSKNHSETDIYTGIRRVASARPVVTPRRGCTPSTVVYTPATPERSPTRPGSHGATRSGGSGPRPKAQRQCPAARAAVQPASPVSGYSSAGFSRDAGHHFPARPSRRWPHRARVRQQRAWRQVTRGRVARAGHQHLIGRSRGARPRGPRAAAATVGPAAPCSRGAAGSAAA